MEIFPILSLASLCDESGWEADSETEPELHSPVFLVPEVGRTGGFLRDGADLIQRQTVDGAAGAGPVSGSGHSDR